MDVRLRQTSKRHITSYCVNSHGSRARPYLRSRPGLGADVVPATFPDAVFDLITGVAVLARHRRRLEFRRSLRAAKVVAHKPVELEHAAFAKRLCRGNVAGACVAPVGGPGSQPVVTSLSAPMAISVFSARLPQTGSAKIPVVATDSSGTVVMHRSRKAGFYLPNQAFKGV
jgi:hypothetical protein